MANFFKYNNQEFQVGDQLKINYRIKEGDKEREQLFQGILLSIKGQGEPNRMITVRKISKSGIGVERIIPLKSPYIKDISLVKKSTYQKSKLYFVRTLSDQKLRQKIYKTK